MPQRNPLISTAAEHRRDDGPNNGGEGERQQAPCQNNGRPSELGSSLSDDLLHNIMSLLTSRQAVQTCVLSRRWVSLWRSVPCLNIDQREFKDTPARSWYSLEPSPADFRFVKFVDSLLRFHRSASSLSLDKFRLRVTSLYARAAGERCHRHGIECCPEVLEICYSFYNDSYPLPPFGSSSCRLRRLHLAGTRLDKDLMLHLTSGCPALEDLELEDCFFVHPKIISRTLKNLAIIDCTTYWGQVLTVMAQALVSLRLVFIPTGSCWDGILLGEMPFLIKASICLRAQPIPQERPFKLLCSLTNVLTLELSGSDTLCNLQEGLDTFPAFPNLRTLLLNECDTRNNMILEQFLNNATSLEKLTLQYCKLAEVSGKLRIVNKMMSRELCRDEPAFECPNLKFTEIRYREADFNRLFGHLSGIWRNLQKSTITLTKA